MFFKCENLQRIGAFKFRGAFNAISQLTAEQKQRGVLAYSSGNHAQAVALAAKLLGTSALIVMPEDAPPVKVAATRGYGAEVVLYDKHTTVREELAAQIAQRPRTDRHPAVRPPARRGRSRHGGKGAHRRRGASGLPVRVRGWWWVDLRLRRRRERPLAGCKVIGVEPEAGDDATRSFKTKTLQTCYNPETIADGARTHSLGKVTFPLVLQYVHDMVTVSRCATPGSDAVPVGAHENRGRTNRCAWRGSAVPTQSRHPPRIARRRSHLRR